jgi:hypothetical protein
LVVLQVLGILLSALSAGIGVSTTVFYLMNPRLNKRDKIYVKLLTYGELTDLHEIRALLEFTRKDVARIAENPEFSKFGAMRRWKEVVRLVFVPGKLDQRQEHGFAAVHPIYGYTDKGEECLVIGRQEFHYLYSNRVRAIQQNQAYAVLVGSLIVQFLGIFSPF